MLKSLARTFTMVAMLFFSCLSLSVLAQAVDGSEDEIYRIERVDHKANQILINDRLYNMPINLVTYIFDSKARKKTKVNRYAMRPGQIVFFKTSIRNQQTYINEVTIFRR